MFSAHTPTRALVMARVALTLHLLWLHLGGCTSARTRSVPASPSEDMGASLMQLATRHTEPGFRKSHTGHRRLIGQKILSKAAILVPEDVTTLYSGSMTGKAMHGVEVEAYARRFRGMFSSRSLTFFQHVSKTAGTLLCGIGKANGCRTPDSMGVPDAINCNMKNDRLIWRPTPTNPDPEQRPGTCARLSAMYAAENLTLAANENYLFAGGLCPDFFNVMLFRDPIARLTSQLSMDAAFSVKRQTGRESWEEAPASPAVLFRRIPASSNNFFIRSLLGRDVYTLPLGEIAAAHLEEAKRVLEQFDVVLVGDTDNPGRLTADIRATLGWETEEHAEKNGGTTDDYMHNLNWSQGDWAALRAANALDVELWEYAKALNLIDRCVFMHPAFARTSAAVPTHACGYLSK